MSVPFRPLRVVLEVKALAAAACSLSDVSAKGVHAR